MVGGVSRVVPSWDSSPPPTTTCNQGHKGSRARRHKVKRSQDVVFDRSGEIPLTSPSDVVSTVSEEMSYSDGLRKPVLSNAEQGIRKAFKKSQQVRSHAAAGQHQALLIPANGEQLGRVKVREQQGKS